MRKVIYRTEWNDYQSKSLHELRNHVEFFNHVHKGDDFDGDYVHRYVFRAGSWCYDDDFLLKINLVNGKVVLRRVKATLFPYMPCKLNAEP